MIDLPRDPFNVTTTMHCIHHVIYGDMHGEMRGSSHLCHVDSRRTRSDEICQPSFNVLREKGAPFYRFYYRNCLHASLINTKKLSHACMINCVFSSDTSCSIGEKCT